MSQQNEAIVRRLYEEVLNGRDWDLAEQLLAPHHRLDDPSSPPAEGPTGFAAHARAYVDAIGAHWSVEQVVSDDETAVVRWVGTGTHIGDLMGIPPTHRPIRVDGINIHRLEDGLITHTFAVWDTFGLMRQLGLMDATADA